MNITEAEAKLIMRTLRTFVRRDKTSPSERKEARRLVKKLGGNLADSELDSQRIEEAADDR